MLKKALLFFIVVLPVSLVFAAQDPVAMLQSTSDEMIASLQKNKATIQSNPSSVYELARKIILPHADVDTMSKLALGRTHWTNATAAQRKQFKNEFTTLMIRTYGSAMAAYTNETVDFKPLRGEVGNKKRVQVDSLIKQQGGPSIPVSYRLVKRGNSWKVYDIVVDGVSMIQSFRSQFASEINRGGMDGLLQAMKQHHAG